MRGDAPGVVFEARDEHPGAELPVELVADGRYRRGYRALEVELLQDVAAVLVLVDGPVAGLTAGDEGPEDLHEQVDALGLVRVAMPSNGSPSGMKPKRKLSILAPVPGGDEKGAANERRNAHRG